MPFGGPYGSTPYASKFVVSAAATPISSSDAATGSDSVVAFGPADSDVAAGADSLGTLVLAGPSDSASGTESSLSSPTDLDGGAASDGATTGPLDVDGGTGLETGALGLTPSADIGSGQGGGEALALGDASTGVAADAGVVQTSTSFVDTDAGTATDSQGFVVADADGAQSDDSNSVRQPSNQAAGYGAGPFGGRAFAGSLTSDLLVSTYVLTIGGQGETTVAIEAVVVLALAQADIAAASDGQNAPALAGGEVGAFSEQESLAAILSDSDSAVGFDQVATPVSDSDAGTAVDMFLAGPVGVDAGQIADVGSLFVELLEAASTDAGSTTESGSVVVVEAVTDGDGATGTDQVGLISPAPRDAGSAAETSVLVASPVASDSATSFDWSTAPSYEADQGTATDVGSVLVILFVSDSEAGASAEQSGPIAPLPIEHGTAADPQSIATATAAADAAVGFDWVLWPVTTAPETAAGGEAESILVITPVGDSDAATGSEQVLLVAPQTADRGSGAQTASIAATPAGADQGSGLEWVLWPVSDSDAATTSEAESIVVIVPVVDGDIGTADATGVPGPLVTDSGAASQVESLLASPVDIDAGTSSEWPTFSYSDVDPATASDVGVVVPHLVEAEAGIGDDGQALQLGVLDIGAGVTTVALGLADVDAGAAPDEATLEVHDTDTGTAIDTAVFGFFDTDLGVASEAALFDVTDTDAGVGADVIPFYPVNDADTAAAVELAGPIALAHAETGRGSEGGNIGVANQDLAGGTDTVLVVELAHSDAGVASEAGSIVARVFAPAEIDLIVEFTPVGINTSVGWSMVALAAPPDAGTGSEAQVVLVLWPTIPLATTDAGAITDDGLVLAQPAATDRAAGQEQPASLVVALSAADRGTGTELAGLGLYAADAYSSAEHVFLGLGDAEVAFQTGSGAIAASLAAPRDLGLGRELLAELELATIDFATSDEAGQLAEELADVDAAEATEVAAVGLAAGDRGAGREPTPAAASQLVAADTAGALEAQAVEVIWAVADVDVATGIDDSPDLGLAAGEAGSGVERPNLAPDDEDAAIAAELEAIAAELRTAVSELGTADESSGVFPYEELLPADIATAALTLSQTNAVLVRNLTAGVAETETVGASAQGGAVVADEEIGLAAATDAVLVSTGPALVAMASFTSASVTAAALDPDVQSEADELLAVLADEEMLETVGVGGVMLPYGGSA